jgi:GPH family glycoside/pentoside/hexuronide:cation symporter
VRRVTERALEGVEPAPISVGATAQRATRLPFATIAAYSAPTLGAGFMFLLLNLYLMKFSTDVLLISPFAMGLIFGLSRIWDAISDPMAGYLSDRTRTGLGRRRPWLLASAVPVAATFVMAWTPPASLTGPALVAWMAVAVFGFYTAMTILVVPHAAWGAELTPHYHDRTRVFGWRHVGWTLGSISSLGAMFFLIQAGIEGGRATAFTIAAVAGGVTGALILLSVALLRERADYLGRGGGRVGAAYADVLRNPHARLLLGVILIENVGGATIAILTPYIAQYVVGRPALTPLFILAYMIPSVASTPLWLTLSRRLGKKPLWIFSMLLTAFSFGGMFFLTEGAVVLISVLAALAGTAGGCGSVVGPSVQADCIDYDEYCTGQRKEGAYMAAWNFVFKGASGVTLMLTGFVLDFSGFRPNVEQTETAKLALRTLYAIFPLVCYVLGTLLFLRFSLGEKEHAEIRFALDERNGRPKEVP